MRNRNYSRGKIDDLPDKIKNQVNKDIEDRKTLMEIECFLKGNGYDISYGCVGRYRKKYLEQFEKLRIARNYAKILAEDNIDRPPTELNEANNALINQMLMEAMIDDTLEFKEKMQMSQAIAALQRSQSLNEKLKIDARKAAGAVHSALNLLKAKVFETIGKDHPDIAAAIMEIADEVGNSEEILI